VLWRNKNNNIGEVGEKAAKKFLKKKGFKIVELNYQNNKGRRLGEIDIIAKKDGEIVFVEVKTRKTDNKYR
jgi:putative endonuclease